MMGEINNAVAFRDEIGAPIIVYDRRFSGLIGSDGAEAVIAHELGHHYCQHLTSRSDLNHWVIENEADAFMGYAMKTLGKKLSQVMETYELLGIDKGSSTHPPFEDRAVAIAAGYAANSLDEICDGVTPR